MRKVLLIEDHRLIAATLADALRSRGYNVEHCVTLTHDEILLTARKFAPDVVLLDHDLGPQMGSSIPLIPELTGLGARVVMLTATATRVRAAECIEAGAAGLLTKNEPLEGLVKAIEDVASNRSIVSESQRETLLHYLQERRQAARTRSSPFEGLTKREQEVLIALMQGRSAQAIADETFTSVRTVRGHIQSVLDKLGVNSQLTAVAKARQAGWPPR